MCFPCSVATNTHFEICLLSTIFIYREVGFFPYCYMLRTLPKDGYAHNYNVNRNCGVVTARTARTKERKQWARNSARRKSRVGGVTTTLGLHCETCKLCPLYKNIFSSQRKKSNNIKVSRPRFTGVSQLHKYDHAQIHLTFIVI